MSQTYYAILTAIGEAKLANAAALNTTLKIAKMAVGDGGGVVPTPNRSQTALVGEWYRAGLNTLAVDPSNTSQIIAELVIPEATGGSWIREMGLIDADGNLIAVANTPPSYKPQLAEGSGRTQVLRMVLIVSSASAVELKIDPSVVLATRQYVDDAITVAVNRLDNKQSVRVATTANLPLTGTPTVDGIALAVGDRILVKNQDTASQNGLYLVAAGTWNRALDADASSEVTPGLMVYVEQGTAQADTIWKLVTDAPITVGNTALAFADITSGYLPLSGGQMTGPLRGKVAAASASNANAGGFVFDIDTGLFSPSNGVIQLAADGAVLLQGGSTTPLLATRGIRVPKGGPAAVDQSYQTGYTFADDGDTGMFAEGREGSSYGSDLVFRIDSLEAGRLKVEMSGGGESGWARLLNGKILQWVELGQTSIAGQVAQWSVTLPTTFPNRCLQAFATLGSGCTPQKVCLTAEGRTRTTISGFLYSEIDSNRLIRVYAIGD